MPTESPGGVRPARRSRKDATATLKRVQRILLETCDQDGQGHNLQEPARRKAYRAGINEALNEIRHVLPPEHDGRPGDGH